VRRIPGGVRVDTSKGDEIGMRLADQLGAVFDPPARTPDQLRADLEHWHRQGSHTAPNEADPDCPLCAEEPVPSGGDGS
jgi:hypothetical protein